MAARLGGAAALLITLLRWGTPESPRWLLRRGRFTEAHAVVHRYFGPHVLLGDEIAAASSKHIKTLFVPAIGGEPFLTAYFLSVW